MASGKKIIGNAAQLMRLKFDEKRNVAYGVYSNYSFVINVITGNRQRICISVCACCNGSPVNPAYMNGGVSLPSQVHCSVDKFKTSLVFPIAGNPDSNVNKIADTVRAITDYFMENGCVNCDEAGVVGFTSVYSVAGKYVLLTDESAKVMYTSLLKESKQEIGKSENYAGGIIGALLGAFAGALLFFLVARLGKIATICGIVMGVAIVFGYEHLGKKFSKVSGVICVFISIVITYLVFRLNASIIFYKLFEEQNYDIAFSYCFKNTRWIYETAGSISAYNHDFLFMMLVGVGGTLFAIWVEYTSQKTKYEMYRLG